MKFNLMELFVSILIVIIIIIIIIIIITILRGYIIYCPEVMSDREFKIKTDLVLKQYSLSTPP